MYDYTLGLKIHNLLEEHNLENPVDFTQVAAWNDPEYLASLEAKFGAFMAQLGLYRNPAELPRSAQRLVDFYTAERFSGLDYRKFPQVKTISNEFGYTEPLIARDIRLASTCEHHLVPITGKVLIAYIPQQYLVGLNKLNQIVEFFAQRPQLQERLTRQLLVVFQELLGTLNIAVVINAQHNCINSGGIQNDASLHSTYQLAGTFATDLCLKAQILTYLGT